jgi:hypothetical protein
MSDYNLTVFVYFDQRSSGRDTLLFSPGADVLVPRDKTASITWVGVEGYKYPAPKLVPAKTVKSWQDDADQTTVDVYPTGSAGDMVGATVTKKEMKGKVTITLHASNGLDENRNPVEVMGDSTIRNKGGNRIGLVDGLNVFNTILNKADPRASVVAGIGMAISLGAGAVLGWLFHRLG